jgi:hypothetical protein
MKKSVSILQDKRDVAEMKDNFEVFGKWRKSEINRTFQIE